MSRQAFTRLTTFAGIRLTALLITGCLPAPAAELPAGFSEQVIATNLNAATAITVAPDGRIFVAGQTGPLRVWKNGRLLTAPALDLTGRVDDYWERGLIGVTLHPDFPQTPQLFVLYVARQPFTHHVVSRFTMLGDRVDAASEFTLLEGDDQKLFGGSQPGGHQGGPIEFGPDGKLYIALGEQTAGKPSQSLAALQGKILRINPDGSIPSDNPFFTRTTGKYRAIWAFGIRNPFGLAFEPGTGRLFETDVGQSSWEEVNEIVRGMNYGWPEAEGFSTNAAFRNPLYAYPPAIGRSIVGAAFCSNPKSEAANAGVFPSPWRGKFFFADWAANWIKALNPNAPTNVMTFAKGFNAPVALKFAPDGSLLMLNRGTIWRDGKKFAHNSGSLVRISYTGATNVLAVEKAPLLLPNTLETTALFISLSPFIPRDGFVEFRVNAPPWQPGVTARRWISIPPDGSLRINSEAEFEFPSGAVVLQHFAAEKTDAPFETQVLWFTGRRRSRAAAYRWSADRRSAALVEDGEVIPLPGDAAHRWFSPGAEEVLDLESTIIGFVLPLSPRQLSGGELAGWNNRGWLGPALNATQLNGRQRLVPLDDLSASLESRIRSYLDVNCAACHRPGGPSRGNFDARFLTPLTGQRLLGGELVAGDLGIPGARVIVPGHPERSVLLQRVSRNDPFRMPPVSVNSDPQPLAPVLEKWIESRPGQ